MQSHPLQGPLILIAAAIIWAGSGVFHAGGHSDYDEWAIGGSIAAAVLFLLGLFALAGSRHRDN